MQLYMVRHGETLCNVKGVYYGSLDVSITEKGEIQADWVGKMLKEVRFDRVIVSGLRRTRETAERILACQEQSDIRPKWEFISDFNEMNFGAWEGKHYKEVKASYPEDYKAMAEDWIHCPPTGGEKFTDFSTRVLNAWNRLQFGEDERVLFVGHGGAMQCIICHLLGMDVTNIWHLEIKQGTYTRFEIIHDFPVLKGMNLGE